MGYGDKVISAMHCSLAVNYNTQDPDTVICPVLTYRDHSIMAAVIGWVVNLSGADLTNAWMYDVDLRGADLTGADLTGARLVYLNPSYGPADITGVTWTNAICPDGIHASTVGDTCANNL